MARQTRPTVRKWKARQLIADLEAEVGRSLDPLEALVRLYAAEETPSDIRYAAITFALPFVYPRLAALQVSGGGDNNAFDHAAIRAKMDRDPELRKAAEKLALAAASEARAADTGDGGPELIEVRADKLAPLKWQHAKAPIDAEFEPQE